VTASEDQPQAIVFDAAFIFRHVGGVDRECICAEVVDAGYESRVATHAVDCAVAPGAHEPRARVGRNSVTQPLLERHPERILQRLLGDVEVSEEADQCGQDSS
jgi:hypothetical protein